MKNVLTPQEMRKHMPSNMDASPRPTFEQAREQILQLVVEGRILMDESFKSYPVPIPVIEAEMMHRIGMDVSCIRPATPQEVERIMKFFDWMKLIREGMAE